MGEELTPADRLRRRADFQLCYRDGRKRHGRVLTVFVRENGMSAARIGVTVTRKVGNSVVRHRLKRVVKEAFRRAPGRRELGGVDIVAHFRVGAGALDATSVADDFLSLIRRRR